MNKRRLLHYLHVAYFLNEYNDNDQFVLMLEVEDRSVALLILASFMTLIPKMLPIDFFNSLRACEIELGLPSLRLGSNSKNIQNFWKITKAAWIICRFGEH